MSEKGLKGPKRVTGPVRDGEETQPYKMVINFCLCDIHDKYQDYILEMM